MTDSPEKSAKPTTRQAALASVRGALANLETLSHVAGVLVSGPAGWAAGFPGHPALAAAAAAIRGPAERHGFVISIGREGFPAEGYMLLADSSGQAVAKAIRDAGATAEGGQPLTHDFPWVFDVEMVEPRWEDRVRRTARRMKIEALERAQARKKATAKAAQQKKGKNHAV